MIRLILNGQTSVHLEADTDPLESDWVRSGLPGKLFKRSLLEPIRTPFIWIRYGSKKKVHSRALDESAEGKSAPNVFLIPMGFSAPFFLHSGLNLFKGVR